ncbi:MAG TPA: thioredoxin family protein [Bryobacteraceae bacterium]|jgi:ketosteroid isomerase-like protein|nr:thioredoxin family protein [Bryobacteraceae bacterium]
MTIRGTAILIAGATLVAQLCGAAEKTFAPLETWKSAIVNGDSAALTKLYSPAAQLSAEGGKSKIGLHDELAFWAGMKARGLTAFNPRVLELSTHDDKTQVLVRISLTAGGTPQYASLRQEWTREGDGWKIVTLKRNPFEDEPKRVLPQPAAPNVALYAPPAEAEAELKAGLAKAAKEHKRVLVVFGGNWCYDCHVLDTIFHSKDFAPLVDSNYVVIHINIGEDGKDNHELAARLGVALDKGVPSLGVLAPDGKVVYAQKNGEFEATEKIGPADVRAFLEKWKPARG